MLFRSDNVKEEARILYVALTRAEDTVTWFKHLDEDDQKEVTWTHLLERGIADEPNSNQ